MWAALEAIKAFLVSPASIAKYPSVRLYGIAWDLHFSRETMILSTETLKSNLNTTENQMHLEKLDVIAVLNLLRLHRERKVIMLDTLSAWAGGRGYYANDRPGGLNGQGNYKPTDESSVLYMRIIEFNQQWLILMSEVARIMEECPDGTVFFQNKEEFFDDWRFAKVLTGNKKSVLVSEFRRILERLPKEVAFPPS